MKKEKLIDEIVVLLTQCDKTYLRAVYYVLSNYLNAKK